MSKMSEGFSPYTPSQAPAWEGTKIKNNLGIWGFTNGEKLFILLKVRCNVFGKVREN
jgi:hypothetical protein